MILIFLFVALALIFCSIVIYFHYENNTLKVSEYNVSNYVNIPDDFEDYTIAQISDFHNGTSKKLRESIIKELLSRKPNIIVITGDFINVYDLDIDASLNFIKQIKDIAPIYFVTGNHESLIPNYFELEAGLEELGVILMDNEIQKLKRNNSYINLIGIKEPIIIEYTDEDSERKYRELTIKRNLDRLVNNKNKEYNILIIHRPELAYMYKENGVNLAITGHAHGGQVRLPFIGGLFAPNQGWFPKYTSGAYDLGDTIMVVSRGLGNGSCPYRVNNKPDLVIIRLNSTII